ILFLQHLNSYAHSKLKERCKSIIHKHKIFSIFHVPISSNGRGVATLYSPSTFKKAKIVFKDKEYRILSTILTTWKDQNIGVINSYGPSKLSNNKKQNFADQLNLAISKTL